MKGNSREIHWQGSAASQPTDIGMFILFICYDLRAVDTNEMDTQMQTYVSRAEYCNIFMDFKLLL